jgi:endonuclease V-like protein UPF0215 family
LSPLRVVGVEDGGFEAFKQGGRAFLCAAGLTGDRVDWVKLEKITVDGRDATETLLKMLEGVEFDSVILGGVSFAGFNIIDPHVVHGAFGVPVIVYMGDEPDTRATFAALKAHFTDWEERWTPVARLGDVYCAVSKAGAPPVYFEVVGCTREWAEETLKETATLTRIPEPVRVAGLIARGLTRSA